MIRPHRQVPAAERRRALAHYADLLHAAQAARADGWQRHEADPVASRATALGLTIWPALLRRVLAEAAETSALVG